MSAANLIDGGVITITNATNPSTTSKYFSFGYGLRPGAHGASLSIDSIAGGTVKIYMSNDTMTDSGASGVDENNATAAQLNALTWFDRTARYASGGTSTISTAQATDFDTNLSYRFLRVDFTTNNATNNLTLRYSRK